jgi:mono/diheme cytochrome c family protein
VSDHSARRQPVIMTGSCFSDYALAFMRLMLPVILMTVSVVASLFASSGESPGPKVRGDAPKSASRAPERPSSSYSPATIAQFRANCVDCHDPDGRGEDGRKVIRSVPDFTDLRWQGSRADDELRRSILEGKGRSMPPMRAKISSEDAVRLVSLVRGFRGGGLVIPDQEERDPAPSRPDGPSTDTAPGSGTPPSRVAPASRRNPEAPRRSTADGVYRQSCRKCHGDDGRGDPLRSLLPSIPDFTDRQWQEGKSKAQLAASILEGKSSHMPAFRSKLGTTQVDELVAYVRAFVPSHRDSIEPQSGDFERRLTDLQREFDELRRSYRELSPPPRRP